MVVIIDYYTKQEKVIINDRDELLKIYNKFKHDIWIGYNSRQYDVNIMKALILGMNPKEVNDKLILENKKGFEINRNFNNIEFYNYDTLLLNTSLKQLEGFMGENIKESSVPFNINRKLTESEIEETIRYCRHDVQQTIKVFEATKSDFDAHVGMIKEFKLPMGSFNKTKAQLSTEVLGAKRLHSLNDEMEYEFVKCIKLNKYKYIQDWFNDNRAYKVENDKGKLVKNQLKTNVMGLESVYGFGGMHSAIKKYQSDGFIVHSDVASFYPNVMINHGLLSRAVEEPEKYSNVLKQRLIYKRNNDERQAPYKIILNATFGICKDKYNKMYDPKRANEITINCQLLLTDLLEKIEMKFGEDVLLIQGNTDGIIVKLRDKTLFEEYKKVCNEWECRTGFTLEHDLIKRIVQKDVNNYIFEFENGKLERKGAYVKKLSKTNYDLPIVNKAIVEYFVNDIPVDKTINECEDLIEFQKISKIGSTYKYAMYGDKILNEKVLRTFAATKDLPGVFKVKDVVNKEGEITESIQKIADTPEKCFIYNDSVVGKKCPSYLDRQYYIDMAKERIKKFIGEYKEK